LQRRIVKGLPARFQTATASFPEKLDQAKNIDKFDFCPYLAFTAAPVVAFTKAAYPDLVVPHCTYHTGMLNRAALCPRVNAASLSGCSFTQPSAFANAVLYAASESIAKSEI
jgi:hypothetical protein